MTEIGVLISHFLPGTKMGGPITSNANMINALKNDFKFYVITSNHDFGDNLKYENVKPNAWNYKYESNIFYINSGFLKAFRILRVLKKKNFDVLYINSFFDLKFSIIPILFWKIGIIKCKKIILIPRGEFYPEALAFSVYKKKALLFIVKQLKLYSKVVWHSSSEDEKKQVIQNLNVDERNVKIVSNIPDLNIENINLNEIESDSSLKIIWLARIAKDKNILYAFDTIGKIKSNVQFDVFGPIEDEFLWNCCIEKAKLFSKNIIFRYMGVAEKKNIKEILSKYDLFFLPTFAENYGHSIVESLSVGTPVLISNNTPWKNLKSDNLGFDIDLNEKEMFIKTIEMLALNKSNDKINNRVQIRENLLKRLDYEKNLDLHSNSFKIL